MAPLACGWSVAGNRRGSSGCSQVEQRLVEDFQPGCSGAQENIAPPLTVAIAEIGEPETQCPFNELFRRRELFRTYAQDVMAQALDPLLAGHGRAQSSEIHNFPPGLAPLLQEELDTGPVELFRLLIVRPMPHAVHLH